MRLGWLAVLLFGCQFDPKGVSATGGAPDATVGTSPDAPPPALDAAPPDAGPMATCPGSYNGSNGGTSHYRFVTGAKSWDQARADCADDAAPYTSLVIIDDLGENLYIDSFSTNRDIWMGIDDQVREGTWVDVYDGLVGYTNWSLGEPSNGGDPNNIPGEDCGQFVDGGLWNDLDCTSSLRYVCECDPTR